MTKNEKKDSNDHKQHTHCYHSIMIRYSCLTAILPNLSIIEENEYPLRLIHQMIFFQTFTTSSL